MLVGLGLAALVGGAEITVNAAGSLAQRIGISEAVVGLTVVAVGTSLPELTATTMAALRGEGQLAFGNVLGSNILNLTLIKGATATAHPIPLPERGIADLGFMAALTVLVCVLVRSNGKLGRPEGAFLVSSYVAFLVARILF